MADEIKRAARLLAPDAVARGFFETVEAAEGVIAEELESEVARIVASLLGGAGAADQYWTSEFINLTPKTYELLSVAVAERLSKGEPGRA